MFFLPLPVPGPWVMPSWAGSAETCGAPAFPRFCFFHSFFETKKPTSQIPETEQQFSFPLESRTREVVSSAFFRWAVGSLGTGRVGGQGGTSSLASFVLSREHVEAQ